MTSFALAAADTPDKVVPVQIFSILIGGDSSTSEEFKDISEKTGGSVFPASGASEVVAALLEVLALPIYSISTATTSITEGTGGEKLVEFTVSRDVATGAATATLGTFGTATAGDVTQVPSSVVFADGEFTKTFSVKIVGDAAVEPDETFGLQLVSVNQPSTIGNSSAAITILNDDIKSGTGPTDGNDVLFGTDGPDRMNGGKGADEMHGGKGADHYYVDNTGDKVIEVDEPGVVDSVSSWIDYTLGRHVENLYLTGTAIRATGNELDNLIGGNEENNLIQGGGGNDRLVGNGGNDWIDGGTGSDMMLGGAGDDNYVFDNVGDVVKGEVIGSGNDTIWASVSVNLAKQVQVENLRLSGTANIDATGSDLNNLITGNAGNNHIAGGKGNDSLYGKGGADVFIFDTKELGAANKDTIWDFDSDDKIMIYSDALIDTVTPGFLDASAFTVVTKAGAGATTSGPQVIYNSATGILSFDADGNGSGAAQDIVYVGVNKAFLGYDDILVA